ncbi:MAG: hypothetical protein U0236_07545 [Nitrospira sp.]
MATIVQVGVPARQAQKFSPIQSMARQNGFGSAAPYQLPERWIQPLCEPFVGAASRLASDLPRLHSVAVAGPLVQRYRRVDGLVSFDMAAALSRLPWSRR